ncbi:SMC-Scp complex subunit ScpB [Ectobacillus ponti]|uniref:Segregation and condensation protein B n=1 Tax=Ectobacillus ponti TaxID=2961894 RepID=A0AA42BMY8_9BACI|nr:SMC-Scp complex subunit ScpB [Ectobacillus ponti]MCP8966926.1 SMC-Scp complex subunit ScpB [Ectobacillus ponti]
MERKEQKGVIEGLLFVSGEEGIYAEQMASVLEMDAAQVRELLDELKADYEQPQRGLQIVQYANAYRLTTKKQHAAHYKKLVEVPGSASLSQAALETLAIIAYRQPITRAEIEEVRGVKTDKALQTLVSRLLIKEVGRAEGTGRPILYGTTREFLDVFGLKTLEELPPLPDELEETGEADLFFDSLRELPLP